MSGVEDSDSGEDAHTPSPPESPSSPQSPPQSPPASPQSPPYSPQSAPASPQSAPASPQSAPASPQSSASRSQSPTSPRSPASPYDPNHESPASSPHSSPSSPNEQKSAPQSPSHPQSPSSVNDQQSDLEASDVEMSDAEVTKEDTQNDNEDNDRANSDNEKSNDEHSHSEAEDSDREENIPEVNIESADENENKSDQENMSDNESEDEKEERRSVHVDSDAENKSDDDGQLNDQTQENSVNIDSPQASPRSPVQTIEKETPDSDKEEIQETRNQESDAEDNADSDSDADSDESEVGGLIADIFGESDDDEEFEGFNEEDIGKDGSAKPKKEKKKRAKIMSDSEDEQDQDQEKDENDDNQEIIEDVPAPPDDDDDEVAEKSLTKKQKVESDESDEDGDRKMREDFVSDFDLMMQKKKEENSKRRKRKDVDLISDSDDLIADIISQMRIAAEEDKELNRVKKTATKKLKILPMVMSQLKKQDLKMAFLDQGVLNVIAEWLTPLPDKSLPHLNIREGMLKQLSDYPNFDPSLLKSSGIGRALMYLFKHPKETKENREKAGKLITEWARPIFNVTTNYHSLTKEEREQRDYDHVPKKRKMKEREAAEEEEAAKEKKNIETELAGDKTSIRPGDKGWIGRARVPMPSTKDYVNRPKWNVEMEFGRGPSKKPLTRIEKHMRMLQDKKRLSKQQRAITISIEGRKMAI